MAKITGWRPVYLWPVAQNFTASVSYDGRSLLAVVVPSMRGNGMHYEINIAGIPRFWLRWGPSDKYELVRPKDAAIPDGLILAVSDLLESRLRA